MSNPYPLQNGDRSKDYSNTDSSQAADRRTNSTSPVSSEEGVNRAPQLTNAQYPLFRSGYVDPVRHTPPYDAIHMEGDTSGEGTVIHEIDQRSYGDGYDPTSVERVRIAPWSLDTDGDGRLN